MELTKFVSGQEIVSALDLKPFQLINLIGDGSKVQPYIATTGGVFRIKTEDQFRLECFRNELYCLDFETARNKNPNIKIPDRLADYKKCLLASKLKSSECPLASG